MTAQPLPAPRAEGDASPGSPGAARLLPWALAFAAYWLAYAGAFRLSRPDLAWGPALRGALFTILPEALLAPAVLALTRRWPLRSRRGPLLVAHGVGALLFAGLVVVAMVAAFALEGRVTAGRWAWAPNAQAATFRGLMALVSFAALASVGHAVEAARRARDAAERAARAEALGAEARLAALRAQVDPHFVSNLLHTLLGLVARDPQAAADGLERLGALLRYAARARRPDGDLAPLADEIAFVDDYLALERLRLGPRLRVARRIDAMALALPAPSFVLQPLIENAVRHAVAPRAGGGTIELEIVLETEHVRMTVRDDGDGAAGPPGDGLGLALLGGRLAALYGGRAALRAGPRESGGFEAEVLVPRRFLPAEDDGA